MKTYRQNAIIVGVLFIIATAFLFFGQAFYDPVLSTPDYLNEAYPGRITVVVGILIEFACVIAIPLIPVVMYPVLKRHSEPLALGYVVFRLFEAVFFVVTQLNRLALISVSQGYLTGDAAFYQNLGSIIQSQIRWVFSMYVVIFAIGALIFNAALYGSKLVPRVLSAWGLIAAAMILIGQVLLLLELSSDTIAAIFYLPIAVQEMVFAVWLIAKGFPPPAVAPAPA